LLILETYYPAGMALLALLLVLMAQDVDCTQVEIQWSWGRVVLEGDLTVVSEPLHWDPPWWPEGGDKIIVYDADTPIWYFEVPDGEEVVITYEDPVITVR
jgi:hypothetical protein